MSGASDQPVSRRGPRRQAATVLLTVAAASLTVVAVLRTRPAVERDLSQRAERAMVLGGYRDVHVRYSGRDADVFGVVRTERDRRRVIAIVRARQGTRSVDAEGLSVDPGAPVPQPVGVAAP